jgi:hypothetical protein
VTDRLSISGRHNGPPGSANGGYTCGLLAQRVDAEVVEVTLRSPPPLEQPLEPAADGERIELHDGKTLIAEAQPGELLLDVPEPVAMEEIERAERDGYERWAADHPFPTCFVCGPARDPGDGLRVFPVELPGRDGLFGARWLPDESLAAADGSVRPEYIWAALDCPTSAPVANFGEGPAMVLARMTARLGCSLRIGEQHSIVSWPLGVDGRKREAAAALYDSSGCFVCASKALWIELREPG